VETCLLTEDDWPRARETVALTRRILALRWFRCQDWLQDPTARIAHALASHGSMIALTVPPSEVSVLGPDEGRDAIRKGFPLDRPSWNRSLRRPFERLLDVILETGRARGHSVILLSGRSILMQPEALSIPQDDMWRNLEGPPEDTLPEASVRILVDRVLWELGMMMAWEMVADILGPNPYTPLLTLYEDGLYPLDFEGGKAVLWAPAHGGTEGERRVSRG
jgi:hypothetical protein